MVDNLQLFEIAFTSFLSGSATVSPSNVLTGVSNTSDREINRSESGTDKPFSHLEIVCRTTLSLMASSSCESPFAFLIERIFSLSILDSHLPSDAAMIVYKTGRCCKQRIITFGQTALLCRFPQPIMDFPSKKGDVCLFRHRPLWFLFGFSHYAIFAIACAKRCILLDLC